MGRRSKAKKRALGKVLSPILEVPEGSRTPTPVKDAGHDNVKTVDVTGRKINTDGTTSDKDTYMELRRKICTMQDSFLDHVMARADDLRDEMGRKGYELRQEEKMYAQAKKDAEYYKKASQSSKLSWTLLQAEKYELRARLQKLDPQETERCELEDKIYYWEAKKNNMKATHSRGMEDNRAAREMLGDVTGVPLTGNDKLPKLKGIIKKEPTKVPAVPEQTRSGSRRPYTGKSRGEQTTKLPYITETNFVGSYGLKSSRVPHVPSSMDNAVPAPPCKTSGRKQIHLLSVLPPIRGSNSVDNVPSDPQEGHSAPNRRLEWIRKRFS